MKKIITLFFLLAFINPLVSYGQSQILEEDVHGDHGHEHEEEQSHTGDAVSYTHLTLPTILLV